MCVGGLLGTGNRQQQPVVQRRDPAPQLRADAPKSEIISPERIKDETGKEDKLSTKKKKALEIKKVREGVKTFGAINPASLPKTPSGGVNTP